MGEQEALVSLALPGEVRLRVVSLGAQHTT